MTPYDVSLLLYNAMLIPVIFFSSLFLILTLINLMLRERPEKFSELKELPFVSVQIPTYNDPIAARCVEHCLNFDYPKDRYEILIVDDSANPETRVLLGGYAAQHPNLITYIHRDERTGFKPGALRNAMPQTKGEILVVFDSDWMPGKDFLRKVIRPFSDPHVAIVQTRQGFYNQKTNIITRFASYLLMMYHTIMMPISNRANCVFFCGTAGALRRTAFDAVGGWNVHSITEDSELSVKLLSKGYKSVYLDFETPSEVPDTFESFIRQQMRWCYGNSRVFFDNFKIIWFKRGLNLKQRFLVSVITLSNSSAMLVVAMTCFGFAGWLLGEPRLMTLTDMLVMIARFLMTAGFMLACIVTLYKRKRMRELGSLVFSILTMGLVLSVANAVAFTKSIFKSPLGWFCTPKAHNAQALDPHD